MVKDNQAPDMLLDGGKQTSQKTTQPFSKEGVLSVCVCVCVGGGGI